VLVKIVTGVVDITMLNLKILIQVQNYFDSHDNWNNSGYEYDVKITLAGIERPAGLEVKVTRFIF